MRKADGRYYIIVEGWNEVALLTLLNIIHVQNRKVPQTLRLEEVAKIAMLVDYYQCHQAVEVCQEIWITHLRNGFIMAKTHGREFLLQLLVASVFNMHDMFLKSTAVAINKGTHQVPLTY
ncbi:hypothetical protein BDU57DRAFT_511263 [Ampelomyces quisqualis]|uniref:BTB domain-containing protein n=1 Tax=Ampelomyces quisqualis TaxID=50730 RepID=A0A6A5R4H4_AMPQU|nr:hypothetical protein BDU57DRAFT_511263 [Ampelomyces quisqualis]